MDHTVPCLYAIGEHVYNQWRARLVKAKYDYAYTARQMKKAGIPFEIAKHIFGLRDR